AHVLGRAQHDVRLDPLDMQRRIIDPAFGQLLVGLEIRADHLDDVVESPAHLEAFNHLGATADALLELAADARTLPDENLRDDRHHIDEAPKIHSRSVTNHDVRSLEAPHALEASPGRETNELRETLKTDPSVALQFGEYTQVDGIKAFA